MLRDAGLEVRLYDLTLTQEDDRNGKLGSVWVVMAARGADLGDLAADPRWTRPNAYPGEQVWTDQFSNILAHLIIANHLT